MTTETATEFLTAPQVAELLGVSADKIRNWITSGELRGVDLSQRRGQRPRWRIHRSDLDAFLTRRSATPPPKPQRRRRKVDSSITEYY